MYLYPLSLIITQSFHRNVVTNPNLPTPPYCLTVAGTHYDKMGVSPSLQNMFPNGGTGGVRVSTSVQGSSANTKMMMSTPSSSQSSTSSTASSAASTTATTALLSRPRSKQTTSSRSPSLIHHDPSTTLSLTPSPPYLRRLLPVVDVDQLVCHALADSLLALSLDLLKRDASTVTALGIHDDTSSFTSPSSTPSSSSTSFASPSLPSPQLSSPNPSNSYPIPSNYSLASPSLPSG